MTIVIQKEILSMIIIAAFVCAMCVYVGNKIKKCDPYAKPTGVVLLALWFVEVIDNQVMVNVRKSHVKNLGPYIGTLAVYLFLCNISGLFGLYAPTTNFSVTLAFAMITWVMIQFNSIRDNGIKGYFMALFDPFFLFFIPNLFSRLTPLLSMSIRLFGNIISGSIIMSLLYSATGLLSNWLLSFTHLSNNLNIVALAIAPVLHAYFDVFAGFIQMFIFISLTQVFISNELKND